MRGDGTFGDWVAYDLGLYPLEITAADLNGDGDTDLAVTIPYAVNAAGPARPPAPHRTPARLQGPDL
jgi:hypothetical protein